MLHCRQAALTLLLEHLLELPEPLRSTLPGGWTCTGLEGDFAKQLQVMGVGYLKRKAAAALTTVALMAPTTVPESHTSAAAPATSNNIIAARRRGRAPKVGLSGYKMRGPWALPSIQETGRWCEVRGRTDAIITPLPGPVWVVSSSI